MTEAVQARFSIGASMHSRSVVLLLIISGLLACASSQPQFLARGVVGLEEVTASVDSQLAAHYLSSYLTGRTSGAALDTAIDALLTPLEERPLSTDALVELARSSSNDFAALYFAERLTREHREIKQRFLDYSSDPPPAAATAASYVIVFVPGLFYESKPETKGDLRDAEQLVRSLGIATARVATAEADTVEANARRIADFVIGWRDDRRRLIFVSASKGGPEVHYALGKLINPLAAQRVRAWVSIGGVLRGSRLADLHLTPPRSWLTGVAGWWGDFSCDMVASLSTSTSATRFAEASLPAHVTVLHYVAVPLSGTVTRPVQGSYAAMQAYGPNDGVTLLTDELLPGSRVIVDVGLDHWYADPRIAAKTAALTRLVMDLLE